MPHRRQRLALVAGMKRGLQRGDGNDLCVIFQEVRRKKLEVLGAAWQLLGSPCQANPHRMWEGPVALPLSHMRNNVHSF